VPGFGGKMNVLVGKMSLKYSTVLNKGKIK